MGVVLHSCAGSAGSLIRPQSLIMATHTLCAERCWISTKSGFHPWACGLVGVVDIDTSTSVPQVTRAGGKGRQGAKCSQKMRGGHCTSAISTATL